MEKKTRVFCDDHAIQVNAAYTSKKEEALSQLQSEAEASGSTMPSDLPLEHKIVLFKDAAGGEKKGGVYGSGSAVSVLYSKKDGGFSSSMARLSSAAKVVEIERKVT